MHFILFCVVASERDIVCSEVISIGCETDIYGLAIAYLLNPIVKVIDSKLVPFFECPKMKRKETFSRGVGILVSLVLLVAVIVALLNMMIPQLYTSIRI